MNSLPWVSGKRYGLPRSKIPYGQRPPFVKASMRPVQRLNRDMGNPAHAEVNTRRSSSVAPV